VKDRRHIFGKERLMPTESSCVCNLPTTLHDQMKEGQGEGEMIILKMNQEVRESNLM
jgi:hypothetical protein